MSICVYDMHMYIHMHIHICICIATYIHIYGQDVRDYGVGFRN